MTETEPQPPLPEPEDGGPATQEWRPFGYADGATGTTEAAGAQLRSGPATTPESGTVLSSSGVQDPATGGAEDEGEVQLPAVLVPDTPETREAEQHPNLAAPPVAGGDLGTADGAGAEDEPEPTPGETAGSDEDA